MTTLGDPGVGGFIEALCQATRVPIVVSLDVLRGAGDMGVGGLGGVPAPGVKER